MSNQDFDFTAVPDPANIISMSQRAAVGNVATSVDDNPDDAAQALKISGATGAPASVVYGDLDHHEAQLKARLSNSIVTNNPLLQNYVNSHPLAAKVSNDDWGALDEATQQITHFVNGLYTPNTKLPNGEIPQGMELLTTPEGRGNLAAAIAKFPIDLVKGLSDSFQQAMNPNATPEDQIAFSANMAMLLEGAKLPMPWAKGIRTAAPADIQLGTLRSSPQEIQSFLQRARASKDANDIKDAMRTTQALIPYLNEGKNPPVGIDPNIDAAYTDLAKTDAAKLANALKATVATATRERAPDLIANNLVRQITDGEIGIAPDAVRKLYGDKVPAPGDGLLGDLVPDLDTKLQTAEATGSDVKVPIADWLAKVEPEVAKELQDHIRARPEGLTVEEAKELPKPVEEAQPTVSELPAPEPTAADTLRKAAGLEPRLEPLEGQPTTKAKQLELPEAGTTRIEDREAFAKASAIGMTVDQYKRYQALIEKRHGEDVEAANARAVEYQRKKQGAEWKANRTELRPQVRDDLLARPEFELDQMLREGKVKLARDGITPEQAAALPKSYLAKDGIHPDDLAGLFGDSSGSDTVGRLVNLHAARGDMQPGEFFKSLVDAETDRQMELRYGNLDKSILEEAKDQVLSETQEQLLHEETLARAAEAGLEYSIGKEDLRAQQKKFFDRQLVRDVSSDEALADAGRAGRAAEMALLKGDAAEAFRQKQRQYLSILNANFARKFEKAQARFERLADKYKARSLPGVEQEYTNWNRDILMRVGKPIVKNLQDHEGLIAQEAQKSLKDFVDYKERHDLREVPVADFIQDPSFRKDYDSLTTEEAQNVHDAVRVLDKNGRDEKKYIRAGEAVDLQELKDKLVDSLQRFKQKEYDTEGNRVQSFAGIRHAIRSTVVAHLQVETVFNRLDRFDPTGPWNQYIFRPMVEGANLEARLEREFSKKLGDIADNVNLKDNIPNSPFANPDNQALPMRMTRKNLRAVMLNLGNNSNFTKLARGYLKHLDPEIEPGENRLADFKAEIQNWVHANATKEDWDWSQKVWDMLKELGDRSSIMYRALTGLAPEKLPIESIQTPHGTYDGGYYPLIRHPTYGTDIKLSKNDLEGQGYVRATTAAGYTKQRTGAVYPLSMDLDGLPNVMRQIIHDTAMRPAIVEVGKIFYDNKVYNELRKHLGQEYSDMMVPWLKDVANTQNYSPSKLSAEFQKFSDFMRQNAVTTLVGFNPSTVLKHTPTAIASSLAEVGPMNLLKGARALLTVNDETGTSNLKFMMQHSEEMQRRMRNWVETMGGGMQRLEGRTVLQAMRQGDYGAAALNMRDVVTQLASSPVALGDFMSSAPSWMGKYMAEMEDHGVHGDAVFAADKAVRQAHGSSAITSKSAVARSKSLSWFTGFFTFFNDLLNRQVETVWRAGEALDLAKEGRYDDAMDQARSVGGRFLAYVVAPAMIEEMVSPLTNKDKESWGTIAAKSLLFTLSSSWVFAREIVNAMLNARDPSVGLITTIYKSITDVHRDLAAVHTNPGNIVKHGTMLTGMLTGLTPAQIGRAAEFAMSKEKPKGPWGWLVGARYGTLKNHSPTFQRYLEGR